MRYLFENWDKIRKDLNNKFIALFFDYDGTLTPIVETPDKAILPSETKKLLKRLINNPKCKIAIISGRALSDLKRLVGIEGVIYTGNHGLEIEGPKIKFESPVSLRYKRILQNIKDDLNAKLSAIKGTFIEDKGLSLSIHYRLVDRNQIPQVKTIFHGATIVYTVRDKIKIKPGKKVFEIRPSVEWDKGKVVLWLLARWKFSLGDKDILPIYLGDDVTDEDAFKALKKKGLTIFVGEQTNSEAQYYLKTTEEVTEFLRLISDLKRK
ncbi:MAG: trehalose-phosphatase [Candidatus Omnitrophota bacterium]|nr:trehalose-phosphatase [Candidatus Omnitrophota bacterium]